MRENLDLASGLPRRKSHWRWLSLCATILVIGAAIGWAATTVLTPAKDVLDSTAFTYVEVVDGEVGSSLNLNTVAEWTPVVVGSNLASGVITSVNVSAGQDVGAGAVLYTVNLRSVVIAEGAIPAFRALSIDSSGPDVTQLQHLLAATGFYSGPADGGFGHGTEAAVKEWQTSLGLDPDGVVQPGDIVFVPNLPLRVALDAEKIERGASLSGGEPVIRGLPPAPSFTLPVTTTQVALVPTGTRVEIEAPNGDVWEGFAVGQTPETDKQTGVTMKLEGKDGTGLCRDACSAVPVVGQTLLQSRIVTVESTTGLIVPSAALLSKANGTLAVIDDKGVDHAVTVAASARGMSVIEGIKVGMMVRVPAAED